MSQIPIPFCSLPLDAAELSLVAAEYRNTAEYPTFVELNQRLSMLHPDALALLYHLARFSNGPILEIGAYIGGSSIALARGLQDAGGRHKLYSVELGQDYRHETYMTSDIIGSLRSNLRASGVECSVEVVVGSSRDPEVIALIDRVAVEQFTVLFLDSDGRVGEDVKIYRRLLRNCAYLVVDDYYSPGAPDKQATTKHDLDGMVRRKEVDWLGVHGWGTWFGRFR